jgi:acyl carrier protein
MKIIEVMSSYIKDIVLSEIAEQAMVDESSITLDEELDFDLFLSSLDIENIIERVEAKLETTIKYDVESLPKTVSSLVLLCKGELLTEV